MDIRKFFGAASAPKKKASATDDEIDSKLSAKKPTTKQEAGLDVSTHNGKRMSARSPKKTPAKSPKQEKSSPSLSRKASTQPNDDKGATKLSSFSVTKLGKKEAQPASKSESKKVNASPTKQRVHQISSSSSSDSDEASCDTKATTQRSLAVTPTPVEKLRKQAVTADDFFPTRVGSDNGRHRQEGTAKEKSPGKTKESKKTRSDIEERAGNSKPNRSDSTGQSAADAPATGTGAKLSSKSEKTPLQASSSQRKRTYEQESSDEVKMRAPVAKERRRTEKETPRRDLTHDQDDNEASLPLEGGRGRKRPKPKAREDKDEEQAMEVADIPSTSSGEPEGTQRGKEARRSSSAANYIAYINREPPRHIGERAHPPGSPDCLRGFVIVMTGVMDYVDKEEIREAIERCGGRVTGNVSGKTTHVIAGRDAGPAKVAKAESVGAQIFDELGWFAYVESITDKARAFPAKKVADPVEDMMKAIDEEQKRSVDRSALFSPKVEETSANIFTPKTEKTSKSPKKPKDAEIYAKGRSMEKKKTEQPSSSSGSVGPRKLAVPASLMWVDKYSPTSTKQIIGQQGDKSNVFKLRSWLTKWSANAKPVFAGKFNRGAQDGTGMKAALLSGPPGVGKTTTAHLVAKELGFEVIELNASDTRSKRSLQEEVSTLLANRTLTSGRKGHLLVMDEVDGMAGNEDRGGIAELIHLIKTTRVPIICICNDRSHQKMRTLVNYCFDLRFYKPQLKQIQAALMSICFKEGVKLSPKLLEEIIISSNQDIRQCVHSINLYCAMGTAEGEKKTTHSASDKSSLTVSRGPMKDVRLGPFDVIKKLFVASEGGASMSLNERLALFFHDYNAIPLFVQENYLQVWPDSKPSKVEHLRRLARASEAICIGDTIEKMIRSENAWGLLPSQALFSAVIPSDEVRGTLRSMVNFPKWFGQYSSAGKHRRQAQALHSHMSCRISGDTFEMTANYLPLISKMLVEPLLRQGEAGIDKVVALMTEYSLQRADMDSICELTSWGASGDKDSDPLYAVAPKVKAKLTRTLNRDLILPYATDDMVKAGGKKVKKETKKGARGQTEADDGLDGEEVDQDEDIAVAMDFI